MPHVLTRSLDRSATVFLVVVAAAAIPAWFLPKRPAPHADLLHVDPMHA